MTAIHPALDGIDLVVFDKDGTLISFEAMWGSWARELGGRLEAATRRPIAGDVFATIGFDPAAGRVVPGGPLAIATNDAVRDLIRAVLRRWCPSVPAAERILADAWFVPDPVADAVPLADLRAVFGALRSAGRRLAIATTDDRGLTEATVRGLGLESLVVAIACGDDEGPRKPDPALLEWLAARERVQLERLAMVGDTPADLTMARRAGARPIGVAGGVTAAGELRAHAEVVLDSVAGLIETP